MQIKSPDSALRSVKTQTCKNLHMRAYSEPQDIHKLPPFFSFYTGAYIPKTPTLIPYKYHLPQVLQKKKKKKKKVTFPTLIKSVLLCVRGRIGVGPRIRRRYVSVHHHPLM